MLKQNIFWQEAIADPNFPEMILEELEYLENYSTGNRDQVNIF